MTVGELKAVLADIDDNRIVVMSCDAEGNDYSPLWQVDINYLWNAKKGSIGLETLTGEDIDRGYREEDLGTGVPALILWPA